MHATTSPAPLRRLASRLARGLAVRARRVPGRAREAVADRRLTAEQRRRVLGPAHRAWREHSADTNRAEWDAWDWSSSGEEWTQSPAWKQALIDDVLVRWIPPGGVVVELGPGAGRWTRALHARAEELILVDVSERALELCRGQFADVRCVVSGGADLPGLGDGSVDAVWSFDVFVHVHPCDQAGYLGEVARVLRPGGVAVIHHADGRNRGSLPSRRGWRAPMSRGLFAALAVAAGLAVERQLDSWGPAGEFDLGVFADAITVCRRPAAT